MNKICAYCTKTYLKKDGEHVFPYGLGGEDVFMDCVCEECNNFFSGLELELYQKSIIGLMRSTEGVEGYDPNKINRAPFKAPVLLHFDEKNQLVLEMGQRHQMRVYLRPQIYRKGKDFFIEADSVEILDQFRDAIKLWRENCLIMTAKDGSVLTLIKYSLLDDIYDHEAIPPIKRIKGPIQYHTLPEDHQLFPHLHPRLFMDDDGNLKIRSKSVTEARIFLNDFLTHLLNSNTVNSFKDIDLSSPIVHVGFSFDSVKLERALVKIGLNSLMHYFPEVKSNPGLRPYLEYVRYGTGGISGNIENADCIIDTVPENHNIFFASTEDHTQIRISLFNGKFNFCVWLNLPLMKKDNYCRLLIDYGRRQHTFQNTVAFLRSFPIPEAN